MSIPPSQVFYSSDEGSDSSSDDSVPSLRMDAPAMPAVPMYTLAQQRMQSAAAAAQKLASDAEVVATALRAAATRSAHAAKRSARRKTRTAGAAPCGPKASAVRAVKGGKAKVVAEYEEASDEECGGGGGQAPKSTLRIAIPPSDMERKRMRMIDAATAQLAAGSKKTK